MDQRMRTRNLATGSLYMSCVAASAAGRNAYYIIAAWVALAASDTAASVAILLGAGSLAEFMTTNFGGSLVDRFDRRIVCILCDVLRLFMIAATGLGIAWGYTIPVLVTSWIAYSVVDRTYLTCLQALIPAVARAEQLQAFNSLAYMVMQATNLVAAFVAGLLLTSAAEEFCFLLPLGCFTASLCMMTQFRHARGPRSGQERTCGIFRTAEMLPTSLPLERLRKSAIVYALIYTMGMLVTVLASAFVRQELNGPALQFGYLEAAWAAGSVISCAFLFCRDRDTGRRGAELVRHLVLSGLALCGFLIWQEFVVSLIQMFVLGFSYNAARILIDVETQLAVPGSQLGRTRSQIHTVCVAAGLFAYGIIAFLGNSVPPSVIFGTFGAFIFVVAGGLLFWPSRRAGPVDGLNET